jgi:hypothetical protein
MRHITYVKIMCLFYTLKPINFAQRLFYDFHMDLLKFYDIGSLWCKVWYQLFILGIKSISFANVLVLHDYY